MPQVIIPRPPMVIIQVHEIADFQTVFQQARILCPRSRVLRLIKLHLEYLKHYIKHPNAKPDADWKLMFMDNHGSHLTPE
jgi:hypothetical protein